MNPLMPRRVVMRDELVSCTERALNLAYTESLFGRWSRYCLRTPLEALEVASLVAPLSQHARLLMPAPQYRRAARQQADSDSPSGFVDGRLMDLLGVTREQMMLATGAAAGPWPAAELSLCGRLRSCWACMANGFHSALFQFHALRACPLHRQPITVGCPTCGTELSPTFASTALSPFACPACNSMWIESVRRPEADSEMASVDTLLAHQAAERALVSAHDGPARMFGVPHRKAWRYQPTSPAREGRAAARWCAWPPMGRRRAGGIEVQRRLLDWRPLLEPIQSQHHQICNRAATSCLQWLDDRCLCARDSLVLRYFQLPKGSKPPWKVQLPAVALHLTMCRYGRSVSRGADIGASTVAYRDIRWNSLQAGAPLFESALGNAELLRLEILGYFAMCLVNLTKTTLVSDRTWLDDADPNGRSLPAWIVELDEREPMLRVRPRVSKLQVERLLVRVRQRVLSATPYFRSIGALRTGTPFQST
jgi:hypothetical protein